MGLRNRIDPETRVSRELHGAPMSAGPFAPGADFSGLPVDTTAPTADDIRRQYHARIGYVPPREPEPWEVLLGD